MKKLKMEDLKDLKKRMQNSDKKIMKLLQQIQDGKISQEEVASELQEIYTERVALNEEFEKIGL